MAIGGVGSAPIGALPVGAAVAAAAVSPLSLSPSLYSASDTIYALSIATTGTQPLSAPFVPADDVIFPSGISIQVTFTRGGRSALSFEQLGHCVAVEIDLYSDRSGGFETLRLCNIGPLFSSSRPDLNYWPVLSDAAINLGTTLSLPTYGQPMRMLSNAGRIAFAIAEELYPYLGKAYHWIGATFRVYEGMLGPGAYREDLDQIYEGRITNLAHDTRILTVQTGDVSVDLDQPMIPFMYPTVSPGGENAASSNVANTPYPWAWHTVICAEPVLVDSANLIYDIAPQTGIVAVNEVRVGAISWAACQTYPPKPGTYFVDLANGRIQLGSDPLGGDVRVDFQGIPVAGIGDLIRQIVKGFGVVADDEAIDAVDSALNVVVGYYQTNSPVNIANVLDDIATGAGAFWGITPLGRLTVGLLKAPADKADITTVLSYHNIQSLQLTQTLPPAWRIRLEYERHWQPETQFYGSVSAVDQQRWSSAGRTISREDATIRIVEPRAYDVPVLRSIVTLLANANEILNTVWDAWSKPRSLYTVSVLMNPADIVLNSTIAVDFGVVSGNYRVISAVRAIGGGPSQIQLWG